MSKGPWARLIVHEMATLREIIGPPAYDPPPQLGTAEWQAQYLCEPPPPLPPGTYCWYCNHDGRAYMDRMVPKRRGEDVPCCPEKDCGCTAHMDRTFTVGGEVK